MMIHDITAKVGAHKKRKRIGRGEASGTGGTSGRGHKGAKSRSGYSRRAGYDAGGKQFYQRFPKRGFSNARFRTHYHVINVKVLEERCEAGETVDAALLAGDPNDGAHPDDHPASPPRAEPPSQTEMLNARLLESFRAALDAVGAEYGDEGDEGEEAGVEAMRAGLSAIRTVAGAPPPRRPDDDFDDDFDVI